MLALTLPLMFAATPVPPAVPNEADARCLAVFAYAAGTVQDAAGKQSAIGGVLYFMGKLKGIDPAFPLEATMRRIYTGSPDFMTTDRDRCAAELIAVGTELTAAGDAIKAKP